MLRDRYPNYIPLILIARFIKEASERELSVTRGKHESLKCCHIYLETNRIGSAHFTLGAERHLSVLDSTSV